MNNAVTFTDNENHCRWNGILMTPEQCLLRFGFLLEDICIYEGKYIITAGDESFTQTIIEAESIQEAICVYLKFISREEKSYYYDNALDEAHGFGKEKILRTITLDNDLLEHIRTIELLTDEMRSEFNLDLALLFMNDLNKFYER